MNVGIFSTAYLPSLDYVAALLKFPAVEIEQWEHYQKQTIRNRCHILSANGIQPLRIPVRHEGKLKIYTKDIKISYDEPWQRVHWSAMQSAYNKSPFFEFYRDDFEKIIFSNKVFLLDMNTELLQLILKILDTGIKINVTGDYKKIYAENDFRSLSDAKTNADSKYKSPVNNLQYSQVFSYKSAFIPNLSIVDLIFNAGNGSSSYLM